MSIPALNWVKGMHATRIKATPRSVLRELADFADERNECWPSIETLCNCTSLSERAVRNSMRVLEQLGLVTTITRRGTSSRYQLNLALDLTQPTGGAPSAPPTRARRRASKEPLSQQHLSQSSAQADERGANGAPLMDDAPEGGTTCPQGGHISSLRGAPCAPKPPRTLTNHQGEARARARAPRPLTADWQPSGEDRAHAEALGLDPDRLAPRFRDHFLASGRPLADVAARWRIWCDEDAERTGAIPPKPAAAAPAGSEAGIGGVLTEPERRMLDRWSARRAEGDHVGQLEAELARQLSPAGLAELHRRQDEAGPTDHDHDAIERWENASGEERKRLQDRLPTQLSRPGLAVWRLLLAAEAATRPARAGKSSAISTQA